MRALNFVLLVQGGNEKKEFRCDLPNMDLSISELDLFYSFEFKDNFTDSTVRNTGETGYIYWLKSYFYTTVLYLVWVQSNSHLLSWLVGAEPAFF